MSGRFPVSKLTKHAEERLAERFRISASCILGILNGQQGKRIGVSAETHLYHRMIWSPTDDALLVVIQDAVDGAVLTVLTLEMYRNHYAENLTEKRVRTVINRMVHAGSVPVEMWAPGGEDDRAIVYAHTTGSALAVSLGSWRGEILSYDLSRLGAIEEFWVWVAERLGMRGVSLDTLEGVTARFSGGDHQEVPYTRGVWRASRRG